MIIGLIIAVILIVSVALGINTRMVSRTAGSIVSPEEALEKGGFDCILVLGAGVFDDGSPTVMLADRLDKGIELYNMGVSDRLLMSGDHGRTDYDEVNVMKSYAAERGVPSEHIFMDHAGFSTYESIYRARDVFEAEKIVIVTQRYHMYRALYIAENLGVEACGVCAEDIRYFGQSYRDLREVMARAKDFAYTLIKPEPSFLGDAIPVSGNGDDTNDRAQLRDQAISWHFGGMTNEI